MASRLRSWLCAETGMRVGELKWLTWADIDWEHNVIIVRPKGGWRPKTGDQRDIPIRPALRAVLLSRDRTTRWTFTPGASHGCHEADRQISERRLLQYLKRQLKKLGLPLGTCTRFGTPSSAMP